MSKKSTIILKISFLSMLAIILLAIMIFFLRGDWSFKKFGKFIRKASDYKLVFKENYNFDDIDSIKFDLKSADVEIRYNDSNDVLLEIYDEDEKNVDAVFSGGTLNVSFSNYNTFCIGFCYVYRKAILYLPPQYSKKIEVVSLSGDVNINEYKTANIEVSTASGDVKVRGSNDLDVNTVSGDIEVNNVVNFNFKSISGDVEVRNAYNVIGSTTSGELNVIALNNYINFSTVSGDVDIKNATLNKNSKITTTSGDVDIDGINLIYVSTSTISGDVDVNKSDRKSNVELHIKTTSGDIDVQ